MIRSVYQPAVPREHDSRFPVSLCSCRRSRRTSRLRIPPTMAAGVQIASTFPRSFRRSTKSSPFGAPPNPRSLLRLRTAYLLRSVAKASRNAWRRGLAASRFHLAPPTSLGPPEVPGSDRSPLVRPKTLGPNEVPGSDRRPWIQPKTLPLPALRFGPVPAHVHHAAAHLTRACSGLATLAADAHG